MAIAQGFYFQLPARMVIKEKLPIKFDRVIALSPFLSVRITDNKNCYIASKDGSIHWQESPVTNEYWGEVQEGIFISLGRRNDDEQFFKLMEAYKDDTPGLISRFLENAADIPAYEARARDAIAAKRLAEEKAHKEREERIKLEKTKEQEKFESLLAIAESQFKNGERIKWVYFEELCKRNGIAIHIRTLGSARESIILIGLESINVVNGRKPDKVFKHAKELYSKLTGGV